MTSVYLHPRIRNLVCGVAATALAALAGAADQPAAKAQIERGRYLVEQVAMCADCHTPRDQTGQFVQAQWLLGSPLAFAPTVPMPVWAPVAPPIAGLPTMTVEQAAKYLETGLKADGQPTRPPMPAFRLNAKDAQAVAAYLKSLGSHP